MSEQGMTTAGEAGEGYVYHSYGEEKYLRYAVASVISLTRYDQTRPVCLVASEEHLQKLRMRGADWMFDRLIPIQAEHASIPGFKHNLYHYMPYERNLYLDSDMIWCRHPNRLWESMAVYPFTITGQDVADNFFGASKGPGVLADILFRRRKRTLNRFGLTYLSRVQSGMIYARDRDLTQRVCQQAATYLSDMSRTHFKSRTMEAGRTEESCEWSLAMAMSRFNLPVYPWFLGQRSPQLDFVDAYTRYDPEFHKVECTYYCDRLVYNFRGLKSNLLRNWLTTLFSLVGGKGDYMTVTPYCIHFGWLHEKQPFIRFSNRVWDRLNRTRQKSVIE